MSYVVIYVDRTPKLNRLLVSWKFSAKLWKHSNHLKYSVKQSLIIFKISEFPHEIRVCPSIRFPAVCPTGWSASCSGQMDTCTVSGAGSASLCLRQLRCGENRCSDSLKLSCHLSIYLSVSQRKQLLYNSDMFSIYSVCCYPLISRRKNLIYTFLAYFTVFQE